MNTAATPTRIAGITTGATVGATAGVDKKHCKPNARIHRRPSGSPGTKLGRGATNLFTVASVIFDHEDDASETERQIGRLRRELRLPLSFEFHFNDAKAKTRTAFFTAIAPMRFSYFAASIDKTAPQAAALGNANAFYRYACQLMLAESESHLSQATVVIDATGGRVFRQTLRTHLLRLANGQSGSKIIRAIRFEDSAASSLVQMADMVSGAVHRSLSTSPDAASYRRLIAHHEISHILWP